MGAVSRYNVQNLRPGAGLAAMHRWRAEHPERYREIIRETARYEWATNPARRAHLAAARLKARAVNLRVVDWGAVATLRAQGLSWRRVRAVTGHPHSTLIGRNKREHRGL